MCLGFSAERLLSIHPHLHLLKLNFPSILSRDISVNPRHQTLIQPQATFSSACNKLVDFLDNLLWKSITVRQTKQIHTQFVLCGASRSAFLAAGFVSSYARFGLLDIARKVFETTGSECISNLFLWNSILRANVTNGEHKETIRLYLRMRKLGVGADGFTMPLVVRACSMVGYGKLAKIVHCHVLEMGFQNHLHVMNELLSIYGKVGQMADALQLFDKMVVRSHISWNTMVSGFSLNYDCAGALKMFRRMELEGLEPNLVTWTSLLSSHARCGHSRETLELYSVMRSRGIGATAEALAVVISVFADSDEFGSGETLHGYVIRGGFENYLFVKNSLITMYGKHGVVDDAEFLFSEMETKSVVTWNALISSYAESGLCDRAFALFSKMQKFDGMIKPNVISWCAVISGLASKGQYKESLELFRQMQLSKIMANSVTISSILSICAELSALCLGREIHGHVIRSSMDSNVLVGNGLINMYTKCGNLKEGHLAFEKMDGKDLFSWNTMIAGYGMHGLGDKALSTFNQMIKEHYEPDGVTFVAVISACSHSGLVNEGRKLFDQMRQVYKIEPQVEHFACMVDLLGRAGLLQEASGIVKRMPMEPNACVWGALLNSCRMYKNEDVAKDTASMILGLDCEMTGSYMLLSNIYAECGKWGDSAGVRISARSKGLKKMPGLSWIEVKNKVSAFSAGNAVEMGMEEIYRILKELNKKLEMEDYYLQD